MQKLQNMKIDILNRKQKLILGHAYVYYLTACRQNRQVIMLLPPTGFHPWGSGHKSPCSQTRNLQNKEFLSIGYVLWHNRIGLNKTPLLGMYMYSIQ